MPINFIAFLQLIVHAGWFGAENNVSSIAIYLDDELYLAFSRYSSKWLNFDITKAIRKVTGMAAFPAVCTGIMRKNNILEFHFETVCEPVEELQSTLTIKDFYNMVSNNNTEEMFYIMPDDIKITDEAVNIFGDIEVKYIEIEDKYINLDH